MPCYFIIQGGYVKGKWLIELPGWMGPRDGEAVTPFTFPHPHGGRVRCFTHGSLLTILTILTILLDLLDLSDLADLSILHHRASIVGRGWMHLAPILCLAVVDHYQIFLHFWFVHWGKNERHQ